VAGVSGRGRDRLAGTGTFGLNFPVCVVPNSRDAWPSGTVLLGKAVLGTAVLGSAVPEGSESCCVGRWLIFRTSGRGFCCFAPGCLPRIREAAKLGLHATFTHPGFLWPLGGWDGWVVAASCARFGLVR
jgi:hypothetical protein